MATRGYASLTGERQLNTLLNANLKNPSKDIKFRFFFFFNFSPDYFLLSTEEDILGHSLAAETLALSPGSWI